MIALAVCLTVLLIVQQVLASKERRLLLNRIQGIPEDTTPKHVPLPQAVHPEDDEGYWKAVKDRPETT